jgi:hypothetical protein
MYLSLLCILLYTEWQNILVLKLVFNDSLIVALKKWNTNYFDMHTPIRVSMGLENPGKSLNWKKLIPGLESPWKSVEVLESPGINFLNLYRAYKKKRRPLEIKHIVKIWMPFQLHICWTVVREILMECIY